MITVFFLILLLLLLLLLLSSLCNLRTPICMSVLHTYPAHVSKARAWERLDRKSVEYLFQSTDNWFFSISFFFLVNDMLSSLILYCPLGYAEESFVRYNEYMKTMEISHSFLSNRSCKKCCTSLRDSIYFCFS